MSDNIHRPVLIIIAGPNGSGKTTITSQILHHEWLENSVYINPDQVAQERFGDWNSAEAVRQSAEYCADWRERCLSNRQSMIFETDQTLHRRHTSMGAKPGIVKDVVVKWLENSV